MKGPVARELEAWGPIVDRLADIAIGRARGVITEREFEQMQALYKGVFLNTPAS